MDFTTLWPVALTMLTTALLAGVVAGLLGIGGGIVVVPALEFALQFAGVPPEWRMHVAVATSLAIIIPTSIRSYYAHRAKRAVDTSVLRNWAVPVVAGVVLGSLIARYAPPELFKIVFVVIAGLSAARLLFGRDSWRFADEMPGGLFLRAYGVVIGVLSTLMGIGGGQLSNMFMTFYGRPIHQAIATSSGLGVLISIPGALGYIYAGWPAAAANPDVLALQPPFALGYVSLIAAVIVSPTSVLTAPLGVRLAHALPKRALEIAFGLFLLVICARFVASLL